jgi:sugar lactone lactonase YvrE
VNSQQDIAQNPSPRTGFRALLSNPFTGKGIPMSAAAAGTSAPAATARALGDAAKEAGPFADYAASVNADGCHLCTSSPDGAGRGVAAVQSLEDSEDNSSSSKATDCSTKPAARHQKPIARRRSRRCSSIAARAAYFVGVTATTVLLGFTTPALATPAHEFSGEFNGGAGHEFNDPTGIAVNNATGDVYVVDKGNNRVEEFNREGGFLAEFKGSGTTALSEPEAIAIDNSGETASAHPSVGDVYVTSHVEVAGESKGVVDKFSSSGAYLGQITEAEGKAFEPLEGIAVDPKGQVWVYQAENGEGHTYIDAFSDAQANAFLSSRESEVGSPQPGFAVDSEDDLYVAHSTFGHLIAKLNSKGKILQKPSSPRDEGSTGVAVEAASNDVYIDSASPYEGLEGTPEIQKYTPEEFVKEESPIETFGEAQLAGHGGTALAVSYANVSSGDVYVVDSSEGKVDMFTAPKATAYGESFHFGGKGAGSGEFTEPLGIAMNDATEDLYVVDKGNKRVEQFNSTGTEVKAEFAPPQGFNEPENIAVDNSCQLQTPFPLTELTTPSCKEFDPSDGDVYVTDKLPPEHDPHILSTAYAVDKFSSTGAYLGQLRRCPEEDVLNSKRFGGCYAVGHPTAGFSAELTGVGVGPEGNVWVGNGGLFAEEPYEFSNTEPNTFLESSKNPVPVTGSSALDPSTGELFVDKESSIDRYASGEESSTGLLESFPPAGGLQDSHGIAVGPAGTVYATERTADDVKAFNEGPLAQVLVGAVANLSPTSVTLQGSVNPEGEKVSSCEFEYGTTNAYGQTVLCEEPDGAEIGEGTAPVEVHADISGLPSGTTYHYRLVASDHTGTNPSSDHTVTTPGPSVTAEQVTYVEAESATLNALIDPDGGATSYRFEYDTSPYTSGAAHGTSLPVPSAAIGAGTSPVPVSVKLTGLQAGKTYYYRAVAEGEPLGAPESFYGINKTFTTNPAKGAEHPQNCANEQPRVEQPYGLTLPDCRAYEMVSPVETGGTDATDSFPIVEPGKVRASEDGAKEAKGKEATPAITYASHGSFAEPHGATFETQLLSRRNVKEGRWETRSITAPLFTPADGEAPAGYPGVFFTPELTQGLTTTADNALTSAPEAAPAGLQELYRADLESSPQSYRLVSHLPPSEEEYARPYQLGPSVYPLGASSDLSHVVFTTENASGATGPLREWVNGRVVSVGVSNEGQVWAGATVGNSPASNLVGGGESVWRVVSEDGSRVIVSHSGGLYARVNVGANVEPEPAREQSEMNGEECLEPAKACTVKLSAGEAKYWGANTEDTKIFYLEHGDLYEYELPLGAVKGKAAALTAGGEVQGVVQISEEGSYVYFVANGVLGDAASHGATPGNCGVEISDEIPQATGTACNLYVSHDGGEPAFIATLSANDGSDWVEGPGGDSAALAPGAAGGARLAFTSEQSLTGYDNQQAAPGECKGHIPDYNGFEDGRCREIYLYYAETGALVCASCDPSGARPVGPAGLATGKYGILGGASNYRPRDLLEDGTLFFDSKDAVVPHASDGRENVYEYEGAQIHAISNVAGGQESSFLDASADGQDVFFASADKLLPEDTSDNVVVWDAREDGGFPVSVSAPACTTAEACRAASPPTPGIYGPPATATFAGPGNLAPPAVVPPKKKTAAEVKAENLAKALKSCKKDKKKSKRAKCEKQARQKYGAKKSAKKASHNGRTKS